MIFDKVENIKRYSNVHPKFLDVIEYLEGGNSFVKGKFDIDGETFFGIGLEYDTKENKDCLWEGHRRYLDIHILLEGEEKIEIADEKDSKVTQQYDKENDYTLFESKGFEVAMKQGDFLLLS